MSRSWARSQQRQFFPFRRVPCQRLPYRMRQGYPAGSTGRTLSMRTCIFQRMSRPRGNRVSSRCHRHRHKQLESVRDVPTSCSIAASAADATRRATGASASFATMPNTRSSQGHVGAGRTRRVASQTGARAKWRRATSVASCLCQNLWCSRLTSDRYGRAVQWWPEYRSLRASFCPRCFGADFELIQAPSMGSCASVLNKRNYCIITCAKLTALLEAPVAMCSAVLSQPACTIQPATHVRLPAGFVLVSICQPCPGECVVGIQLSSERLCLKTIPFGHSLCAVFSTCSGVLQPQRSIVVVVGVVRARLLHPSLACLPF